MGLELLQRIEKDLAEKLNEKFNQVLLEGLRRKGYHFSFTSELEGFLNSRCSTLDSAAKLETVYFVEGVAFLRHKYSVGDVFSINHEGTIQVSVELGSYEFL